MVVWKGGAHSGVWTEKGRVEVGSHSHISPVTCASCYIHLSTSHSVCSHSSCAGMPWVVCGTVLAYVVSLQPLSRQRSHRCLIQVSSTSQSQEVPYLLELSSVSGVAFRRMTVGCVRSIIRHRGPLPLKGLSSSIDSLPCRVFLVLKGPLALGQHGTEDMVELLQECGQSGSC